MAEAVAVKKKAQAEAEAKTGDAQPADVAGVLPLAAVGGKALVGVVDLVRAVVSTKTTLPMLSAVRLDFDPAGHVRLHATDLEQFIVVELEASIKHAGAVLMNGARFEKVVKALQEGTLAFAASAEQVVVTGSDARYSLPVFGAVGDFPPRHAEAAPAVVTFTMKAGALAAAVRRVSHALSGDETRPVLGAIFLELTAGEPGLARFTTTDGHRLFRLTVPVAGPIAVPATCLIAGTTSRVLPKVLKQAEDVAVSVYPTSVEFVCGPVVLAGRLIEGQFPHVDGVIPDKAKGTTRILGAETLADAVRKAALVVDGEPNRTVQLEFHADRLVVSAKDENGASSEAEVAGEFVPGPAIRLNAAFLLDAIAALDTEDVPLTLYAPDRPVLLQQENATAVVMPLR